MFEEVTTLVIAVAIAGALLAVGAAVLVYFNPQQPADHANALAYPLVRPLNETHVQLGIKPIADHVEVEAVAYQRGGTWMEVPVKTAVRNETWLQHGGKPLAVPCGANVTVSTRYGSASRALSFHVACLDRQSNVDYVVDRIYRNLYAYAEYVLDYVYYKSVPVLTAYFAFGSLDAYLKNIGPYPFMFSYEPVKGLLPPQDALYGGLPRLYATTVLKPGEAIKNGGVDSMTNLFYWSDEPKSVVHRFVHVVAHLNGSDLWLFINSVPVYRGQVPKYSIGLKTPQGFRVTIKPDSVVVEDEIRLNLQQGLNEWVGWLTYTNLPTPMANFTTKGRLYVMPAGPRLENNTFGVVPPFIAYSVVAKAVTDSVLVYWYDASCIDISSACLRNMTLTSPGVYMLNGSNVPSALVVYSDQRYFVAVASAVRSLTPNDGIYFNIAWKAYPGVDEVKYIWYWWDYASGSMKSAEETVRLNDGPLKCEVRNGYGVKDRMGLFWELECFDGSKSLGKVRIQRVYFRENNTYYFDVYANGTFLHRAGPVTGINRWMAIDQLAPVSNNVWIGVYWSGGKAHLRFAGFSGGGYGAVKEESGSTAAVPVGVRMDYRGAYVYDLAVDIKSFGRLIKKECDSYLCLLHYNYSFTAVLTLYLNGNPVAYDAMYGWGIYTDRVPNPNGTSASYTYDARPPSSAPNQTCVPQYIPIPAGVVAVDFQPTANGYHIGLAKNYVTVVTGCGQDQKLKTLLQVTATTVDGKNLYVTDPEGRTCNYQGAVNCGGVVCCGTQN